MEGNDMGCGASVGALGGRAPPPSGPCRVIVHILAAKALKRKEGGAEVRDPVFKLRLEQTVRKSRACKDGMVVAEDGVVEVNQSFSFQVKDPARASLTVQVLAKGRLGMEDSLGRTRTISVSELLLPPEAAAVRGDSEVEDHGLRWYRLLTKDGSRAMPGQLQMHIVAAVAEPEQRVSALVGTWNVGNTRPPDDLSPWLPLSPQHEIVAVGSQECEYSPSGRQGMGAWDCGADWVERLGSHLGRSRYRLVQAVSRGQMRLAVFVREDAARAVTDVHTSTEATGVGHVVANKGGVCICLKFWDTGLCFVNSHFAAHVGHCEARNSNFREITGQMRVGIPGVDILNQFHHVFWMGDLNYRLAMAAEGHANGGGSDEWRRVVGKVRAGDLQELLTRDELRRERDASRVFHGFKEGDICFAPTFKLRKGTVASYHTKRVPAWCDRILWKDLPGCPAVELLSYTSAPEITTSDHKPVAATFSFTARSLPTSASSGNVSSSASNSNPSAAMASACEERWNIRFRSLRARELRSGDINGLSDPYVSFVGPMLLQEVHSKVKPQTLNPVWEPAHDLPPLVLTVLPLERLRMEYLTVRVMDRDYASSDDYLANGVIPLACLVDAFDRDEVASFQVELTYHGLPAGTLEGSMQLTYEKSQTKKKTRMRADIIDRTLVIRDSIVERMVSRRHVT